MRSGPQVAATVVVPTTGDRGPLLRYSVGSALAQTVSDIEVLVIGDGIDDSTRAAVTELVAADDRVRLFEFPKGASRGETNRHHVLTSEARGEVVCYLCDRDLWLPGHLEALIEALGEADFGHSLRFGVDPDGALYSRWRLDLTDARGRARHQELWHLIPLSFAGHTMDAYRRLPHGWRETPSGRATDRHMWAQFLDQSWCRVGSSSAPTVLYFKRGPHEGGWSTSEREAELARWWTRMQEPGFEDWLDRAVLEALLSDRSDQALTLLERDLISRLDRGFPRASGLARAVGRRVLPARLRSRIRPAGMG